MGPIRENFRGEKTRRREGEREKVLLISRSLEREEGLLRGMPYERGEGGTLEESFIYKMMFLEAGKVNVRLKKTCKELLVPILVTMWEES